MHSFRKLARRFCGAGRLLEGTERVSGQTIRVLYSGLQEQGNYIAGLVFGNEHRETETGRIWIWRALKHARETDADILIAEADRMCSPLLKGRGGVFIPCWVKGEVNLKEVLHRFEHSADLKGDRRRIRKNRLTFEVDATGRHLRRFYDEMYMPYVGRAHGETALYHSCEGLRRKMAHGVLLLVKHAGEFIAGSLLVFKGRRAFCSALGVRNGDRRYLRIGAVAACYYFEAVYLCERGFETEGYGSSRAFLSDGVLAYKRKWGMRITGAVPASFWIRPLKNTPAVRSFFVNNPFVHRSRAGLAGAVFSDNDNVRTECPGDVCARYRLPGMTEFGLYAFGGRPEELSAVSVNGKAVTVDRADRLFGLPFMADNRLY